jgi:hypothetical protein
LFSTKVPGIKDTSENVNLIVVSKFKEKFCMLEIGVFLALRNSLIKSVKHVFLGAMVCDPFFSFKHESQSIIIMCFSKHDNFMALSLLKAVKDLYQPVRLSFRAVWFNIA